MTLSGAEILQSLALPLLGWLTWEIRNLRKELESTRMELADRIHVKECNRRMAEQSARLCSLEKDEMDHIKIFHAISQAPTITREL